MNFLAHFALSQDVDEHMVGNFLSDLVKNDDLSGYAKGVQQGVHIHRKIDTFTDSHPLVLEAKTLISSDFRRYSGILLDVYFDYLLIKNWRKFYTTDLTKFIERIYCILKKHESTFPNNARAFSQKFRQENLIASYGSLNGIEAAFRRIDQRLKKSCNLSNATKQLIENENEIENLFLNFYVQLNAFAKSL